MARENDYTGLARKVMGARLAACMVLGTLWLGAPVAGLAQDSGGNPPPPMQPNRPPMERAFEGRGPMGHDGMGRWWDNPQVAKDLNLASDQKQKMDDIFQQNRPKLTDLHTAVQKEEETLYPLVNADTPDEAKILAQIDRVAQARAELEKANARMLLAVRQVLTADQWTKLKAARAQRMASRGPHGGPDGGPGMAPPPN
jgi:periplasmic protein CpxP/Spy